MHRPDHSTAGANAISAGVPGYVEGDPLAAPPVPRTIVTDDQLNDVVEGLCRLVEGAGETLSKGDYDQIVEAAKYVASVRYAFEAITYTRKNYTGTQSSNVTHAEMNSDGTKLYMLYSGSATIYEYDLSTPWDVSTASYDSVSLSVTTTSGFTFGDSGSSLYVLDVISDVIRQYDLSTAWDLSTASITGNTLSVSGQEGDAAAVFFKSDGETLFIVGSANDTVYEYTLSTAWDLSTGSYASVSKSVTSEDTSPGGLALSDDGLAMFVLGTTNDAIFEYTLSTAWDVSTASYTGRSYSPAHMTTPQSISFARGGRILLVIDLSSETVHQYNSFA